MSESKNKANNEAATEHDSGLAAAMEELKRDMRSAQLMDWVQRNRQQVIAMAVAVVVALAGAGLWIEKGKSSRENAATLYHQALVENDVTKKRSLLEAVVEGFGSTTYATLAHMQLAKLGDTELHLKAVINSGIADEFVWQAQLDLAEWYLANGTAEQANAVLAEPVGKQYEQLRQFLLAEAAADPATKIKHLQLALDAVSNDAFLKDKIEAMLAELNAHGEG